MTLNEYNYNNELILKLNKIEVQKNNEKISEVFKDYEILKPKIVFNGSNPYLALNHIIVAEIENYSSLETFSNIYVDEVHRWKQRKLKR
ncbi:hypothetical protein [Staphylococcus aureus]|uniref:hypothetical protein n=1 Tax=Staphylococcus aureus TaxID=1280 RepID=UPI0024A82B08|nr:hypothetical protein [Staphylococcus aureus]